MDQDEPREATPDVGGAPSDELLLALREQGIRDQAFEALPDAALLVDRQGVIADLNRRAVDLLGRSPDERVDLDEVLASDDGSSLSEAERRPLRVEARRVDGSTTVAIARATRVQVGPDTLTMYVLSDASEPFRHVEVVELEADRRRMQELERVAAEDAVRLERRVARLQAITDAALAHLSLDQLFEALLERLRELLNAEAATVLLLDPELRVLKIATTSGLPRGPEDLLDVPLGSGVAGRIATGRRPVIIGDLRRVRSVNPFIHTTLRSLVGVPIIHRGEVTGVVHVGSLRARHFTEEDITLLEIVAARLAPAIENAQLHAFERAARAEAEQDARRLRLLQQIAEELGSIRPVEAMADAVVGQISSALHTAGVAIAVVAPGERDLRVIAASGFDDATRARWASIPLDAPIPLARAVQERRAILIASTGERDASFPTLATTPTIGRSWASLPLVVDGAAVGALGLSFREERAFDASDVELFTAIAHQAAQAIDRASRYDAERRSVQRAEATARRLSLLQSLTARFSRALTPREVASVTVEEIATALGAPSGAFFVLDDEGMFELQASHGYRDVDLLAWRRFPADLPTPAGDALRTGELVVARTRDELLERYPSFADHVSDRSVGATVTVPVGVDERAIGAAAFTFAADRAWHDEDLELLRALGRHAGQALERARLFETERRARRDAEQARERTERLQALAGELIEVETEAEVENLLSEHILAAAGGNASVVVRLFDDGMVRIVASRGYVRDTIERDREMDIDAASPLNDAMRSRVPVWITSREEFEERYPLLLDDWQRLGHESSFAAIPLKVADRIVGAVGVRVAETDPWDEEDKNFLRAIARQAAQAIEQTASRRAEAQARAALELSERRNRSLIETTSAIHWTMDPAGAFVEPQASWSDFTGQTWDAYRGFGWVDAVHPGDRDALLDSWVEARDDGVVYTTEARLHHAGRGEYRQVVVRAAPVRDDDGHISEWVGTVTDVHDVRLEQLGRIERERAARAELEEAGERLAYLADASGVLAASLDVDQTMQRLADLAVPRLADWCTVDMLEPDGSIRLVAVAHVDPKRVELAHDLRRRYPTDPEDETGVPNVLRTGRPVIMPEIPEEFLDEAKRRNPELADLVDELQLRSMMTVPIAAKDRVLGAISFVWAESGHRYDQEDLALAEDLARRAAVAIENARLYEAESEARRREARARARVEVLAET
ncbi:MAG TPA: GAF domain-containing protein, partial [Actinomycetota bacterium]|nr:GAF domain-containing protein [Actinomycetota bacterium]